MGNIIPITPLKNQRGSTDICLLANTGHTLVCKDICQLANG